jgi:acyl-CoA thioester hydrolase
MKIRVYYEDTDVEGIVYHAKYINFCERARSEIFFSKNKNPYFDDYYFVVKKIEANYFHPAYLGDMLEIKTAIKELRKVLVKLNQEIYRDGEKIFQLEIELVCLKNGKVAKIPDYFLEILEG